MWPQRPFGGQNSLNKFAWKNLDGFFIFRQWVLISNKHPIPQIQKSCLLKYLILQNGSKPRNALPSKWPTAGILGPDLVSTYSGPSIEIEVESPNVLLIGVCSLKALSVVEFPSARKIRWGRSQPLPCLSISTRIKQLILPLWKLYLKWSRYPSSGNSMMS